MDGRDILYKLFPHDADKSTMSYYLEYLSIFGGIRGGYPAVYGLYKSAKTNMWVTGSGNNRKEINENEAIKIAKTIVDALKRGVDLIRNSSLNTVNDYVNLENELNIIFNDCTVNANYSWVHKYFSLLCPDVIPVIHQDRMKKDMIRKFHMKPLKGYYANDAQLYMLSRDAGITLYSLFHEDIVGLFYNWDDHMWVGFDEKNLIDLNSNISREEHNVKEDIIEPEDLIEEKVNSFNLNPDKLESTLKIEEKTLYQIASVLNSSKNLILEGVPGTGKTHLAVDICEQLTSQKMCNGYIITTATSDWTTFDVIGGLMLDTNGNLNFEEGIFLKAIRENKLLIIDEINRADIDKAFGQLFTVLSGSSVELNYKIDSKNISIKHTRKYESYFDESEKTYYIGCNFRIIATMNNYDKDSLYDMSYAFMRRFGFVEINIPGDNEYEDLIMQWNQSFNDELPLEYINNILLLLGLNNYRKLGPAIFEDIMKYMSIRKDYGKNEDILEEIIVSYIIPQFEGLQRSKLKEVKDFLVNNHLLSEEIADEKFEEYGLIF